MLGLLAAGVSAASSILGGQSQSRAAKKAAQEYARAAAEARSVIDRNTQNVTNMYAPQVQMGQNILGQLSNTYGIGTPGQPDWNAYIAQNGDVAAIQAVMNGQAQGTQDQLNFIAGFQQSGKSNIGEYHASVVPGRPVPTTGGTAPSAYQDPTAPQGYSVGPYTAPTRPQIAPLDVSLAQYEASPDYLYQLTEGNRNLNAGYAAKGLLQSGAAMKALQKYGQDSALEDYDQWRNYKTGVYQWDANRSDQNYQWDANFGRNVYESDRNYGAQRYDAYQNRLFQLADIGQRGMDRTAETANNAATANANIITGNGQVQAQSKVASANALAKGWSGAAGAASNLLGSLGGGSSYGGSYGVQNGGPVSSYSGMPWMAG